MKHLILLLLSTLALNLAFAHTPAKTPEQVLSQQEWLTLKPREIAKRTGQKMGFFQRLALKMVQKKVRKSQSKPKSNIGNWAMRLFRIAFGVALIGILLGVFFNAANPVIYLVFLGGLIGMSSLILALIALGKGDFRGKAGWDFLGPLAAGILGGFAALFSAFAAIMLWTW